MAETTENPLADDLLDSADEIALFLYGDAGKRRRVYHLADTGQIPAFKFAGRLHARKSALLAHIQRREATALAGNAEGRE